VCDRDRGMCEHVHATARYRPGSKPDRRTATDENMIPDVESLVTVLDFQATDANCTRGDRARAAEGTRNTSFHAIVLLIPPDDGISRAWG
jgi:hypothetical protein